MDIMDLRDATRRVALELSHLGLSLKEDPEASGFLPGIALDAGVIHYSPSCLPSDLLHEAGHLAICPESFRHHATGNLSKLWPALRAEMASGRHPDPDTPFPRACLQCSDPEATAWAFAFGRHCSLPPEAIIVDETYDGTGASIRLGLELNCYAGINGLRAAGFLSSVRDYPRLTKWLQNGI